MNRNRIQIKICGLTDVDQAVNCAELGADAIGCVFFERSPRNINPITAKKIIDSLPRQTTAVGVFVDEPFSAIMQTVNRCGLTTIQLHGQESPELVNRLQNEGLRVIKALFAKATPLFDRISDYKPDAFLLECGKGSLPGGNALIWNWGSVSELNIPCPFILAGGLAPENVAGAIESCLPDAVDVSSGVESEPGIKDMDKVQAFIAAVNSVKLSSNTTVFP